MMNNSILIRGGRVIDPKNGVDQVADVLVKDGKIAEIGENLSAEGIQVIGSKVVLYKESKKKKRIQIPR